MLHLAIAYDLVLCAIGGEQHTHGLDLASSAVVGELVGDAKLVQRLILSDPRFGVSEDELLQLEWVP